MAQLTALLISIGIESPLIMLAFHRRLKPFLSLLILSIVPTMITHPFLWAASVNLSPSIPYLWGIVMLESAVIIIEAFLLSLLGKVSIFTCLLVSLAANCSSTVVGIFWWRLWV